MTIASPSSPSSASAGPASAERYHGQKDFFEHANCTIQVDWEDDVEMCLPWKEHDGHGVVVAGTRAERLAGHLPVPRYLRLTPRGINVEDWYYDFDSSLVIARKGRWGLSPEPLLALRTKLGRAPTEEEVLGAAVRADFEHLRAWCHDEWCWLSATVLVNAHTSEGDCFLKCLTTMGGIESTTAAGWLDELVTPVRAWIDENQRDIAEVIRAFELQSMKRRHLPDL